MRLAPEPTRRKKAMRVATVLTGVTAVAAAGTAIATPAHAGTDGQEICVYSIPYHWSAAISGDNQHDAYSIINVDAWTPWVRNNDAGDYAVCFPGYWWNGYVRIQARSSPDANIDWFSWLIPTDWAYGNIVQCGFSTNSCDAGEPTG
jgi:hypothetical protein